jgi:hypothetical protein
MQIVVFYVLINSAFVGRNNLYLSKMHGKTTIKMSQNLLADYCWSLTEGSVIMGT